MMSSRHGTFFVRRIFIVTSISLTAIRLSSYLFLVEEALVVHMFQGIIKVATAQWEMISKSVNVTEVFLILAFRHSIRQSWTPSGRHGEATRCDKHEQHMNETV